MFCISVIIVYLVLFYSFAKDSRDYVQECKRDIIKIMFCLCIIILLLLLFYYYYYTKESRDYVKAYVKEIIKVVLLVIYLRMY